MGCFSKRKGGGVGDEEVKCELKEKEDKDKKVANGKLYYII